MSNYKCPLCSSTNVQHRLAFDNFEIVKCFNCSLEFLFPLPSDEQIRKVYGKKYFFGMLKGIQGYKNYDDMEKVLMKEAYKKLEVIELFTKKRNLLDVGAGTGIFLEAARAKGFQVAGNDISEYSKQKLKEKDIKCFFGSLDEGILPKDQFDVVTAWDVLEHIPNPNKAMETIHSSLRQGGYLFMTTPDVQSIDAKILGSNWYGYKKIPEHVTFYGRKSLKQLLEGNGFRLIEKKVWGFEREFSFILRKLTFYHPLFKNLSSILKFVHLYHMSLFFPLTDCMVIAQKKT